ncbi:extracellular solute-binding protein [Jannaschia marina]|uniref:extracellular solute-binding protein n=1 Tax=Jannaschia marina TaxID=2741674 RepID=UPI0015CC15AF|nr:extracellular solute-binding protein [Jannaschia marina]
MTPISRILCTTSLTAALTLGSAAQAEIEFWTMPYGDQIAWKDTIDGLLEGFTAETGIEVTHETVPWGNAFQTYLTIAQGGAAPDCADMYWLHSFSAIGGENYGPLPITEYADRLDLDSFYEGALTDVTYLDEIYGIPWRGDIRAILYRTDAAEEAGLSGPPTTWDETVAAAKAMHVADENGNVDRWGYAFGTSNVVSWLMPLYWQAGGEFMSEDGTTATIDNQAMRDALTFMHDMVHVHRVVDIDSFEKGYEMLPLFVDGQIALIGSAEQSWGKRLDAEYPDAEGTWAMAPSAAGPEDADSFSGAGYFGVLRGTEQVEECVSLLEYLSQNESILALSQGSGNVATKPAVMQSEFWSDRPWKQVVAVALEDAHTSQHAAPSWSAIATSEPGGIIFDLIYNTVVLQEDMDAEIATAQELMQGELDR